MNLVDLADEAISFLVLEMNIGVHSAKSIKAAVEFLRTTASVLQSAQSSVQEGEMAARLVSRKSFCKMLFSQQHHDVYLIHRLFRISIRRNDDGSFTEEQRKV